ncbi:hypothetical protein BKA69DRAFT_1166792 [Paraphysoderma sedebokerense]|nr:hypothetical protein BKA69DRAFT_1166792 [Paraphysoderma sedebokerense]
MTASIASAAPSTFIPPSFPADRPHSSLPTSRHVQINPTPDRSQRRKQFGIDCADFVHFTRWELGGEHSKQLLIKNVSMKTQKIKYQLPHTRYFSMPYPETMTLSAGMNWTIPITFRPVAKEEYHDFIEFTTSFGTFNLPIRATLPEHSLTFPASIDFSYCPVKETAKKVFTLKNSGELRSFYDWKVDKPFRIVPSSGELKPNAETRVTVEYNPEDASAFSVTAACAYGDPNNKEKTVICQPMQLYGVGKYSHLKIEGHLNADQNVFDFGEVFVGKKQTIQSKIRNLSLVPANFKIKSSTSDYADSYFRFSITKGTISPNGETELSITFTPLAPNIVVTEHFDVKTKSGNSVFITCSGSGVGPKVTLSTAIINFGDVEAGNSISRAIHLTNNTNIAAYYQFQTEPNAIFRIDKVGGTIGPNTSIPLTIKFSPREPINYYRRVFCLIENQDALFVDLIGTCYDSTRRPATFYPRHLQQYAKRVKDGLYLFAPEQLEDMLKNGVIEKKGDALSWVDPNERRRPSLNEMSQTDSPVGQEFFLRDVEESPVSLLDTYIDFGSSARNIMPEPRIIRVANNTKGKMSCHWITPGEITGEPSVFFVTPKDSDIQPKSVAEFRVIFRPTADNAFYGNELECFAHFKSMRNFRLVNEGTFTPPWCLTLQVAGNTFSEGQESFIPKLQFPANRLDFPACHVDACVYRTVRVTNAGDTPVKFIFQDTKDSFAPSTKQIENFERKPKDSERHKTESTSVFAVKPQHGTLAPNQSQLFVLRFSPTESKLYEWPLKCLFNNSLSNIYEILMRGVGSLPSLSIEDENRLFLKPTCADSYVSRKFRIRNNSSIHSYFKWKIPEQFADFIQIEPAQCALPPNSLMELDCVFKPQSVRKWIFKIPCFFSHTLHDLSSTGQKITLTVIAESVSGQLTMEPENLNLGTLLVNRSHEFSDLTLLNQSDCDIHYKISVWKCMDDAGEIMLDSNDEVELKILEPASTVSARSQQNVRFHVELKSSAPYKFKLKYQIQAQQNLHSGLPEESTQQSSWTQLCDITTLGVYPCIQITDIKESGVTKSLLWESFSLSRLNEGLRNLYSRDEMVSSSESESYRTVNFEFATKPVGSDPAVLLLNLTNTGVVPVEWSLLFPRDLQVEVEQWAESGDCTNEQLNESLILEKGIFTIEPKVGQLDIGQSQSVTITYSHVLSGTHRLPVYFRIKDSVLSPGKDIHLLFSGITMPSGSPHLHFYSKEFVLNDVSIGTANPPIQMYRLINTSTVPIKFEIDQRPLDKLKTDNYDFEILSCRNTTGSIEPGKSEFLEWIFHPLEEKLYEVDLPIIVNAEQATIIKIKGHGFLQPRQLDVKLDPHETWDVIPPVQNVFFPGQMMTLSMERLLLGHLPLTACLREIITVRNQSEKIVSFTWKLENPKFENVLSIEPSSGQLQPNESQICEIIFSPLPEPVIYEISAFCESLDVEEWHEFEQKRSFYEKIKAERRQSMEISDLSSKDELSKKAEFNNKYSPLPPITGKSSNNGLLDSSEIEPESNDDDGPRPPPVQRLELAVLARTYAPDEYKVLFKDNRKYHYNDQLSSTGRILEPIPDEPAMDDPVCQSIITNVLLDIVDDIMKDPEIQQLPKKLMAGLSNIDKNAVFPRRVDKALESLKEEEQKEPEDIEERPNLLQYPDVQDVTESILENALFDAMQEFEYGDLTPSQKPIKAEDQEARRSKLNN